MDPQIILEKVRQLPILERRKLPHETLVSFMQAASEEQIMELATLIGYPVFTRLCMGDIMHKFILLQDGAAIVIENEKGEILLQRRADRDQWGLPGGCQELGEPFEKTITREVKEEANLDVREEDLEIIAVVSGPTRRNSYPNGDIVFNNTVFYRTNVYSGDLRWDSESKEMRFFPLDQLPNNQNDPDLIEIYLQYRAKKVKIR